MDVGVWMDDGMGKISVRWGICPSFFFFAIFSGGLFFFLSFQNHSGTVSLFGAGALGRCCERESLANIYSKLKGGTEREKHRMSR